MTGGLMTTLQQQLSTDPRVHSIIRKMLKNAFTYVADDVIDFIEQTEMTGAGTLRHFGNITPEHEYIFIESTLEIFHGQKVGWLLHKVAYPTSSIPEFLTLYPNTQQATFSSPPAHLIDCMLFLDNPSAVANVPYEMTPSKPSYHLQFQLYVDENGTVVAIHGLHQDGAPGYTLGGIVPDSAFHQYARDPDAGAAVTELFRSTLIASLWILYLVRSDNVTTHPIDEKLMQVEMLFNPRDAQAAHYGLSIDGDWEYTWLSDERVFRRASFNSAQRQIPLNNFPQFVDYQPPVDNEAFLMIRPAPHNVDAAVEFFLEWGYVPSDVAKRFPTLNQELLKEAQSEDLIVRLLQIAYDISFIPDMYSTLPKTPEEHKLWLAGSGTVEFIKTLGTQDDIKNHRTRIISGDASYRVPLDMRYDLQRHLVAGDTLTDKQLAYLIALDLEKKRPKDPWGWGNFFDLDYLSLDEINKLTEWESYNPQTDTDKAIEDRPKILFMPTEELKTWKQIYSDLTASITADSMPSHIGAAQIQLPQHDYLKPYAISYLRLVITKNGIWLSTIRDDYSIYYFAWWTAEFDTLASRYPDNVAWLLRTLLAELWQDMTSKQPLTPVRTEAEQKISARKLSLNRRSKVVLPEIKVYDWQAKRLLMV